MPAPRPYAALGARIRALRQQTPLTQYAVAARAGISHAYPSAIELGKFRPDPDLLRTLVRILHDEGAPADYDELAALAGYGSPVAATLAVAVDEADKLPVLQRLARLNRPVLEALEEIARRVHVEPKGGTIQAGPPEQPDGPVWPERSAAPRARARRSSAQ